MGGFALRVALLLAPLSFFAGCGSAAKPTYQLTQAEAAIRAAEEVEAEETPQAALHLKMAHDQVREAKELIINRAYEQARHLLRRAEADANLAIALAKEADTRAEAQKAKANLEELRREMR